MFKCVNRFYAIRVFTSGNAKRGPKRLRKGCGSDAIRTVVRVFSGRNSKGNKEVYTFGAKELSRVYRTGTPEGILSRLDERLAEAMDIVGRFSGPCPHCGGAFYKDSGTCISKDCRVQRGLEVNDKPMPEGQKNFLRILCARAHMSLPVGLSCVEASKLIESLKNSQESSKA